MAEELNVAAQQAELEKIEKIKVSLWIYQSAFWLFKYGGRFW